MTTKLTYQFDPHQQPVWEALNALSEALVPKLFKSKTTPKGIYIWGGVGRGKTFLMDRFYQQLSIKKKRRTHYHRFMREINSALHHYRQETDPLKLIAKDIAKTTKVLCLDEFLVQDIGNAMIMAELLKHLFKAQVVLVTTSNTAPNDLYKNGLQRAKFLPAIDLLNEHCQVIKLVGDKDHRLQWFQSTNTFHTPLDPRSQRALDRFFQQCCRDTDTSTTPLIINDRQISVVRRGPNIVWFKFGVLCASPCAVTDYIQIAREYPNLILSGMPILKYKDDETKRLINLIDELYNCQVKVLFSAVEPIQSIYRGKKLIREFERTESRIIEMGSEPYWAKPHCA